MHTACIDTICNISTMNHLDNSIQDYEDDAVDGIYADGDTPARGWDPYSEEDYPHTRRVDQRWRPVAAIAGIVFTLAVIATVVILNGGDSASTTATVATPPTRTVIATPRPSAPAAPPASSLLPETVTTVTPPPRKPEPTATAGPTAAPTIAPPPEAAPPVPPEVTARTFVYQVTGTKQLLDVVTVIYTDAQGVPQTDVNVSLPWSRTVVTDPGVAIRSVVATSITSRLSCSITDGAGQPIAVSSNSMIATCTR
jgi:MmpS family membrane protein